jgi:branched-chain amino acid transport system substrate-binding protein
MRNSLVRPMALRMAIMALCWLLSCSLAYAQRAYDPGASDTEIKIGNVAPYTGALSEFATEERAQAAYFRMINDHGGVNGRKLVFITVDDGSDQRRSPGLARQLVESEGVLLLFSVFGAQANLDIRTYANEKRIPQLFVQSNASTFDDPSHFPWTMGFFASTRTEALAYASYIAQTRPAAKVGILRGDDRSSSEYIAALREGLGATAPRATVTDAIFKYSDPATIDAQIEALKASGADVFINLAIGRSATRAIGKAYDANWHPLQFIPNASLSIAAFIDPAGLDKATGIITNARSKGWASPQARADPAVKDYLDWMRKYNPDASLRDQIYVGGYERAQALVEVLRKCGDDLTRANVMKQAASLDFELPMLLPGIRVRTTPADYQPIKDLYLVRFSGKDWIPVQTVTGR